MPAPMKGPFMTLSNRIMVVLGAGMLLACSSNPTSSPSANSSTPAQTGISAGVLTDKPAEKLDKTMDNQVPTVMSASDIERNEGQLVHVIGTYELMDVRKKQTPPPVYKGHAEVKLEDGTRICLLPPWKPEAVRPQQERDQYAGQKVAVHGFIVSSAPPDPSGAASIVMPCMAAVTGIVDYELYEMSLDE